jgi:splicing factor U2AF subunit
VDSAAAQAQAANALAALNATMMLGGTGGSFGVVGEGGLLTKANRELYIGNLPTGVTVPQLTEFLNAALKQLGAAKDGIPSVVACWLSADGHYGFVEIRTVVEADVAMAHLNGVAIGSNVLRVGRPKSYTGTGSAVGMPMGMAGMAMPMQMTMPMAMQVPMQMMQMPMSVPMSMPMAMNMPMVPLAPPVVNPMMTGMSGVGGSGGVSGPSTGAGMGMGLSDVLMLSNLPSGITDEQVRELVSPFGPLKAFNSIKTAASQSAVFEYADPAAADGAIAGLDGLDIGENKLSVQRVPTHAAALLLQPAQTQAQAQAQGKPPLPPGARDTLQDLPPTTVLRLSNMTTPEDLKGE